jgi:AcrR family transcriptional regulator
MFKLFLNIVHGNNKAPKMPTDHMVNESLATRRRAQLKEALIAAAERTIEVRGLHAVRARALAQEVGCAVGGIYNVFEDLDELVLLVNSRTLAVLEREIGAAIGKVEGAVGAADAAIERLVQLALAYLDFAAANPLRWRALFEFNMPNGQPVPDWYLREKERLFGYVEEVLSELQTHTTQNERALRARSLFSAAHGLVALGLEEKLQAIPLQVLREQVTFVVTAIGRGIMASGGPAA